jgi:hypothetical protein
MKLRRKEAPNFLESLLDTLANVIGILIIVAAVTHISMGDAVRAIEEKSLAADEPPEIAPSALAHMQDELNKLQAALQGLPSATPPASKQPPETADLDGLETLLRRIREQRAQLERDRKALADARKRLEGLQANVAQLPVSREVSLPNPRPAPPNLKPIYFVCRKGKIHPANAQPLIAKWEARLRAANNGEDKVARADLDRVLKELDKDKIEDQWFRVSTATAAQGTTVFVDPRLEPKDRNGQGETLAELRGGKSLFAAAIRDLDASRSYVLFLVWADSFDIFIESRHMVEASNLATAWGPFDFNQDWIAYPGRGGGAQLD